MRDGSRPESHVDVGIEVEDALPLRLRIAPADGDDAVRVRPLERGGLSEVGGEPLVRFLAHRAGVEDDHVRRLRRGCLPQAEVLEHALDPLGIVGVHLTSERGDVVALHAITVAPVPAATWRIRWRATPG
jgi:hypothetical protein